MNDWIVATYKINELTRLKKNLHNQGFEYYIAKIKTERLNLPPKEELLFPGYVFINSSFEQYTKIKYTRGIKNVIHFNNKIPLIDNNEIKELKNIEKNSYMEPIIQKVSVGQEAEMPEGPFKGSLIKIASMPKKDRVNILIYILGSKRKISVALNELKI
jgi:transcription antitermination factor NusG